MKYIEVGLYDINPNPEAKKSIDETFTLLNKYSAVVEEVNDKIGTNAFIAGGAIRDLLFGYHPRDVDIFLPVSPEEDKDDEAVFFCESFRKIAKPWLGELQVATKIEPDTRDITGYNSDELAAYHISNAQHWAFVPPQVIAREGSVEDIVNSFDYDLVKAYYKNGEIFVIDTFPTIAKSGKIVVETLKAKARVNNWRRRTGHKVSIRCLQKVQPKDYTTTTIDGGYFIKIFNKPVPMNVRV